MNHRKSARGDGIPQLAQPAEVGSSLLRVFGKWRHRHQSAKFQRFETRRSQQQFLQCMRVSSDAALRGFAAYVDLDENLAVSDIDLDQAALDALT